MILRHYNLFVSSTFKDMDVERDIVKFEVIPALNQMFNKKGVAIQAIDLRYGINTSGLTEDEASDKVLNICMNSIDRARPFFIGFVGNRYGWVPSPERWQEFYKLLNKEQKTILRDSTGMSITEMEILYSGLFSEESNQNRYLFFLRDSIIEDDIPTNDYNNFVAEGFEYQRKNKELRLRIKDRCDQVDSSRCYTYSVRLNNNELIAPGLAQKLIDSIAEQIENELKENEVIPDNRPIWTIEGDEVWTRMCHLADQSILRPEINQFDRISGGNAIICGQVSSGKSTMLAQLCLSYFQEDQVQVEGERKILLYAAVNRSSYSRNIFQIMGRWVIELAELLRIPQTDTLKRTLFAAAPMHHSSILELFYDEVDMIHEAGHSVHIFIDDLDQFHLSSPGDERLDWVDERVTVYATIGFENLISIERISKFPHSIIQLFGLVEGDAYVRSIQHRNFCDLPVDICEHFASLEYTFLEINTLFKMVRLFNKDDYRQMRNNSSFEDSKVYELFESLPRDYMQLFDVFVEYYSNRNNSKQNYYRLVQLLIDHPAGIRICDIIDSMSEEISSQEVYRTLYYFDDFVDIEYDTEIVKLKHHPKLYTDEVASLVQSENKMMKQASQYLIVEAMLTYCNQIGVDCPKNIESTKKFINLYQNSIIGNSLRNFVINAYLSILYDEAQDIENAVRYADDALLVANRMGESMNICRGHILWAKAMMLKEASPSIAKDAGISALSIFESDNVIYEDLPDLYMLVGYLFEKDGAKEDAVKYYKPALDIMQKMKRSNYYGVETIDELALRINHLLS